MDEDKTIELVKREMERQPLTKSDILHDALQTYLIDVVDAINGEMYADFDEPREVTLERYRLLKEMIQEEEKVQWS